MARPEDAAREKASEFFEWLRECWPSTAANLPAWTEDRLANVISAAIEEEREACAKACEALAVSDVSQFDYEGRAYNSAYEEAASAIRNRKGA